MAGDAALDLVQVLGTEAQQKRAPAQPSDGTQPQVERQERFEVQDQPKAECRPDEGKHMIGTVRWIFLALHGVY